MLTLRISDEANPVIKASNK